MTASRPVSRVTRVHLPSGRTLRLEARAGLSPRGRRPGAAVFSELVDLVSSGDLTLFDKERPTPPGALALVDFHALRAIATRLGWLEEAPVAFPCRNCEAEITHAPCAALELGPFLDGELDDPELDGTLDLSISHPIPPVTLDEGRLVTEVRLAPRTVAEAAPLHEALRRRRLRVDGAVVKAAGIAALGPESDPERIARALGRVRSDATARRRARDAWEAIGDLFLRAHYSPRLFSAAVCGRCGARNDVDAPYEREFEPAPPEDAEPAAVGSASAASNAELFPGFDAFDAEARAVFARLVPDEARRARMLFIVDGEIPPCDDGGEPLLGAYLPPGGDPSAPVGLPEISLYYRSFRAMWADDGPYDWRAEIETTVAHELEHDAGWLTGHDPQDDEERAEIADERALVVGRGETARAGLAAFRDDVSDFMARTWPIWLIVAVISVAISVCGAQ